MIRAALTMIAACSLMQAAAADPLEGRWLMAHGGALIDIAPVAHEPGHLVMTWVDGPALDTPAGSVVGHITATATPGLYDCHATARPDGSRGKASFTIQLDPSHTDSFSIRDYHKGLRINIFGLLPYSLRHVVRPVDTRPAGLYTARRALSHPQFLEL